MNHEANACRDLWVAVVLTAAHDLVSRDPNGLAASQARAWIGTADFARVCALSGFEPQAVAEKLRALDKYRKSGAPKARRGQSILSVMRRSADV